MCSGTVLFASITAMAAADDGISNSTVQSARRLQQSTVWSTWYKEPTAGKICTACGKSKECVKECPKALCAWNSGLVTAMVTDLLTRTLAGTQCLGFTLKKYHPHRLKGCR